MGVHILIIAHKKEVALKKEVRMHLSGLVQGGHIDILPDPMPGEDTSRAFKEKTEAAQIAILLLSPDLLGEPEQLGLPTLLAAHTRGSLKLLPVLARPCRWEDHPALASLLILPRTSTPLSTTERGKREAALVQISEELMIQVRTFFDCDRPLDKHTQTEAMEVNGAPLVAVRLFTTESCQVEVVAAPEKAVGHPTEVHVFLEFSRDESRAALHEVYRTYAGGHTGQAPFVALCIRGPRVNRRFCLDDTNPSQWQDARDSTMQAIKALSVARRPTLHIFAQAPAVLALAIGMALKDFWPVYLYNYRRGIDPPYARVL